MHKFPFFFFMGMQGERFYINKLEITKESIQHPTPKCLLCFGDAPLPRNFYSALKALDISYVHA